ncbi:MAG: TA system VapC family ribonuclease toxin, partial [Luteolibacter sp.]
MILPDANLLLYAYDQSSPFHPKAAAWCEKIMSSSSPVILLPVAVFAFVKISTHPRIFTDPLSVAEASSHVRSWLGRKQVRLHDMLLDDVESALTLLESAGTAGNLTTDAQIAAVALRLDAEVHTADLDF